MSANLWDASTANPAHDANGVYVATNGGYALTCTISAASAFAENQTVHMGASLRGADRGFLMPFVEYKDAAGHLNWAGFQHWTPTDDWQRFEGSCVVPSGMTVTRFGFNASGATGSIEVTNPVFSYGSPVALAIASSTVAWSAGILATTRYYQLAAATAATPAVPTSSASLGAWTETEPAADTTKVLWTCERTVYTDGTEGWSKASKSTSYEAAKDAKSVAMSASAAAKATASHFWLDAAGQANVSTDAGTVDTGHSVTIGAKGIIQRLDGKLMQSLTKTALGFYMGDTPQLAAQYTPDGMNVYAAGKTLSSFTGSGAVFYDGTSDSPTTDNVTASFGSDGAIIGKAATSGDVYAVIEDGAFSVKVKE